MSEATENIKTEENELGVMPVKKLLFKLAAPAITAQLVNLLYNLVDRMFIGHIEDIGALALTGVGVCMPLIMVIAAFAALAGMGAAPRSSIMMGRNNKTEAEKILGNSCCLLIIIALCLTVLLQLFSRPVLLVFGGSENTIGYAMDYMSIYSLGTVFVQLTLGLNAFITAQGFAKMSMRTVMIGAVCNIILDPIFIFALGMGVKGAALATVISQGISALWVIKFLTGKKTILRLQPKYFRLEGGVILPCLLLGLSPFIMQATESLISVCFNSSLLKYGGDVAVGAMTVLSSVMQFSMLPLMGLSQGAQPITGYNYGAKNAKRVKETFYLLLKGSVIYSLAIWLVIMIFPRGVALMFSDNEALLKYSVWALRHYMLLSGIFGIQIACQQTFIAIGNAKTSLFLAVYRKIILLIPLIYIMPMLMENKARAVFLAEPVADLIAVTTTAVLFSIQFKKAIKKLENEPSPQ